MLIKYELYRSKDKNEEIDRGILSVPIETNPQLLDIDSIILHLLDDYINGLEIIKKFGRAYVGAVNLVDVTVTNEDKAIDITEEAFKEYMNQIIPNLKVVWNKTTNESYKLENPFETESENNTEV